MSDRARGPERMSDDELAEFLATKPTGALCVDGPTGSLRSHPIAVAGGDASSLELVAPPHDWVDGTAACVVVDTFRTYEEIKGAIVQGRLRVDGPKVALDVDKVTTFSFGPAMAKTPPEPRSAPDVRP